MVVYASDVKSTKSKKKGLVYIEVVTFLEGRAAVFIDFFLSPVIRSFFSYPGIYPYSTAPEYLSRSHFSSINDMGPIKLTLCHGISLVHISTLPNLKTTQWASILPFHFHVFSYIHQYVLNFKS